MNKREFVLGGCAVACGGNALLAAAPAMAGRPGSLARLPGLAADARQVAWQRHLHEGFRVEGASVPQILTLGAIRPHDGSVGHEQFSLVFEATPAPSLGAGTRTLQHASGQRVAVYLEPLQVGANSSDAARYAAHFSLLV